MGALLLLAVCIFGVLVLFGKGDTDRYYKFLIFLIVGPILASIALSHVEWYWDDLSLSTKGAILLLTPFLIAALARGLLPRSLGLDKGIEAVFSAAVTLISFPIRLLWRVVSFVFVRERHSVPLDRYQPTIGTRPPMIEDGRRPRRTR